MLSNQHHAVMRVTALSTQEKNIRLWHVLLEMMDQTMDPVKAQAMDLEKDLGQLMDQTMDPVTAQAMDLEKDLGQLHRLQLYLHLQLQAIQLQAIMQRVSTST